MPELDDRLRDALRGAARVPDRDAETVAAAVTVKRRRRLVRRRAATGLALATVVATALVTTVVVVNDRETSDGPRVATNGPAPPPTTIPPPPTTAVPPEEVEAAQEEVVAAAPTEYAVEPRDVTVLASGQAMATVTDAAGTSYEGVRFEQDATGWRMTDASTCRLPGADPAACAAVPPDVLFLPGKVRLGPEVYSASEELAATPLSVEPDRYVRGPLLAAWQLELAAAYERVGGSGWSYPPSHVMRFTAESTAGATVADLEGEIRSFAAGGDLLWAVTHERFIDPDRVEYRLKRIDRATGNVVSMPLPPGAVPAGPVAASAGGAWVPLRDGVIGFAPAVTAATRIDLPEQETRNVAVVDGRVYATSGTTIRRIDAGTRSSEAVLDTGGIEPITGLVASDTSVWALAGSELLGLDREFSTIEARGGLPPGLRDATLHADTSRVWATGVADLAPATDVATQSAAEELVAVLVDDSGIAATLVLAGATDANVAVSSDGMMITSRGIAYRVDLPV